MQSSAIASVASTAIQHSGWRVCCICGQSFRPISERSKGRLCRDPECRSEVGRRNGGSRGDSKPAAAAIQPQPGLKFRTILQPQIAPYIASLAAASKTMETRA